MPVKWQESPRGWIIVEYTDPYSFEEAERAIADLFTHHPGPGLRILVDRRRCAAPQREFIERLVAFGDRHRAKFVGARVALVVTSDVSYGMGRMLENLGEAKDFPTAIRTFRNWDAAEQWLDAAEPSLLP